MTALNSSYPNRDERFFAEMDAAYAAWLGPRDRLMLHDLGLAPDQRRVVDSLLRSAFTSGARFTAERVALKQRRFAEADTLEL